MQKPGVSRRETAFFLPNKAKKEEPDALGLLGCGRNSSFSDELNLYV